MMLATLFAIFGLCWDCPPSDCRTDFDCFEGCYCYEEGVCGP